MLVRNALHAVRLARIGEALLIGCAAGFTVAAAAVFSGGTAGAPGTIAVCLLSVACAATSWLHETRPRAMRLASCVDLRLRMGGELLTAYESERADPDARLAQLLVRRVRGRLMARDVVRASLPNSLPLLGLPFAAAALLFVALEASASPPPVPVAFIELTGGLADELAVARELAYEAPGDGPVEELVDLAREARAVHVRARGGVEGLGDEVGGLARKIDDLRREMAARPEMREALSRAAGFADAAAAAGEAEEGRPGQAQPGEGKEPGAGEGAQPGEGAETGAEAGEGTANGTANGTGAGASADAATGAGAEKGAGGVEIESGDGTMAGRPDPDQGSSEASAGEHGGEAPPPPEPVGGVRTGRWWPEQHAGVVGRWVEARRAARGAQDESND